MGKTYGEYLKEMRDGMPGTIRVDFGQPITPEILGEELSDAWKERYGQELENWARALDVQRHEFQRVADAVSKVLIPHLDAIKESGILDSVARASAVMTSVAKEQAERQELVKSFITPLALDFLPTPRSTWLPADDARPVDREVEMDALADRVTEKLWARMTTRQAVGPRQGAAAKNVPSEKIERITLVNLNVGGRCFIIINEAYNEPLTVNRRQKAWGILFRVAEEERIEYAREKHQVDYLTVNRRCKLYTTSGYPPCKILISVEGFVKPGVAMEIISEKAYKQRLAKIVPASVRT